MDRFRQKFKENLSNFKLHLFPVHSGIVLDGESSHWTLLALDYETKSARWYETLDDPKEFCLSSMTYICELCAIKMPDKRENLLRQTGVECGLGVMHYLEKEMRMAAGEGKGSVLGFVPARWREMRQTLGKMTKMLVAFKQQLLERHEKEKAQVIALETLKTQSVEILELRKVELQKLKDAQSAIGEEFFSGVDLDVVLPADFQPKKTRISTKSGGSGIFQKAAKALKNACVTTTSKPTSKKVLKKDEPVEGEPGGGDEAEPDVKPIEEEPGEGGEAAPEVTTIEEDPVLEKAELILAKGEKGFEKWLRAKSVDEVEKIVGQLKLREKNHALDDYLTFVKAHECLGVCAKCSFKTGCVACDYQKALAYAVRHQSIPYWWAQKHGLAFKKQAKKKTL